jgi:hypothetical protein
MIEMKDDERNYYFTIIHYSESEGFKVIEKKVNYYQQILVKKDESDEESELTLKFMQNEDYLKYKALYDGCFITEFDYSYYYIKDYIR